MDADNRVIPIVEDDQGEGYKDLLEAYETAEAEAFGMLFQEKAEKESREEQEERLKHQLNAACKKLY